MTPNWNNTQNYTVKYPDAIAKAPLPQGLTLGHAQTLTAPPQLQTLLDKLQEESAEVIQAVSKVRRFGEQNHHPDRKTSNHQDLVNELTDFLAIVAALEHLQYFDLTKHQQNIQQKTTALISS